MKWTFHSYTTVAALLSVYLTMLHVLNVLEVTRVASFTPLAWTILYIVASFGTVLSVALLMDSHSHNQTALSIPEDELHACLQALLHTLFMATFYVRYQGVGPETQHPLDITDALERKLTWYPLHLSSLFQGLFLDVRLWKRWANGGL